MLPHGSLIVGPVHVATRLPFESNTISRPLPLSWVLLQLLGELQKVQFWLQYRIFSSISFPNSASCANISRLKVAFLCGLFSLLHSISIASGASDDGNVIVPLMDDGALIRIPVVVFGNIKYFVVDTGTSVTTLDSRFADRLVGTGALVNETTSAESFKADVYNAPKITIGGEEILIDRVICNDMSLQRMVTGEECDGILGMDVLHQYSVTIDLVKNELLMAKNAVSPESSKKIRMIINDDLVQIPATIDGKAPVLLMVDSASNAAVSMNQRTWCDVLSSEEKERAVNASYVAFGGLVETSRMTRLHSVKIGDALYSSLICQLISKDALSSVGLPFFRHNRVMFDFPHSTLYLDPMPGDWVDERDMSGLHLLKQNRKVVVYSVDLQSPAESCGIKVGDVIERIDNEVTSLMTMKAVRARFRAKDGEGRSIQLVRGSQQIRVNITLKRII
jgi:hypothetical protein